MWDSLDWIYTARDSKELAGRYDQMAETYDHSVEHKWGWTPPRRIAEVVTRYVASDARVLDAGAGTGLAAEALSRQGFRDLYAIDISDSMLAKARMKGIYREVRCMDMTEALDFASNFFDAVMAVGVLTIGHAPASALDELVRITRPGGHIIYTLRPDVYETGGFKEKQASMEAREKWKLVERTEPFLPMPKQEPDIYFEIWAYKVIE